MPRRLHHWPEIRSCLISGLSCFQPNCICVAENKLPICCFAQRQLSNVFNFELLTRYLTTRFNLFQSRCVDLLTFCARIDTLADTSGRVYTEMYTLFHPLICRSSIGTFDTLTLFNPNNDAIWCSSSDIFDNIYPDSYRSPISNSTGSRQGAASRIPKRVLSSLIRLLKAPYLQRSNHPHK